MTTTPVAGTVLISVNEAAELVSIFTRFAYRTGIRDRVAVRRMVREADYFALNPVEAAQVRRILLAQYRIVEGNPDLQIAAYGSRNRFGLV